MIAQPKVSVIIPVYNMGKYLEECLTSVVNQTLKEIEIICVNDGSTDDSLAIMNSFAQNDARIIVIDQENQGVSAARNAGIKTAQGEFVCFMDPDDYYPDEDVLKTLYNKAVEHHVNICGGCFSVVHDEKIISDWHGLSYGYTFKEDKLVDYSHYQFDFGYHRFLYSRKMLLDNNILFPPYIRFQDPPFFVRAMICAKQFYGVNKVVYRYREGHKPLNWTEKRIHDHLCGVNDLFVLSKEHNLNALHIITYKRLTYFIKALKDTIKEHHNELVPVLLRINRNLDRTLLEKIDSDYAKHWICTSRNDEIASNSTPKVSVLMPSLNVAQYICECMNSVVNQTLKDNEIICIDAGSTDGTLEILKEYERLDPRVRVIVSDKKSYGYQMNLGLDAAQGEYIGIVETDDWVEPDMFEKLYTAAKENDVDVVKSNFYLYYSHRTPHDTPRANLDGCPYNEVFTPIDNFRIYTAASSLWSGIYRRALLLQYQIRFNETPGASYQDTSFYFMLFTTAQTVYALDQYFVHYRQDNEAASVQSEGKVFCICDESRYYENFLNSYPEKKMRFMPFYMRSKFDKYRWNYNRIAAIYQWDFLVQFQKEYAAHRAAGNLVDTHFDAISWHDVNEIIDNPVAYFRRTCKKYCTRPMGDQLPPTQIVKQSTITAPDATIVIPAFNNEDVIARSIESALAQTHSNIEILCVNDGSSDKTLSIMKSYAERDERITILSHSNKGRSASRNAAMQTAKGRYVQFLDSDDELREDTIERLVKQADEQALDVLYFDGVTIFEQEEFKQKFPYYLHAYEYPNAPQKTMTGKEYFCTAQQDNKYRPTACMALFNLAYLKRENIRFIEGIIHEDNAFTFAAMLHANRVAHCTEQLYQRYLRSDSTMTSAKTFMHVYGYLTCFQAMLNTLQSYEYDDRLNTRASQLLNSISSNNICADYNMIPDKHVFRDKLSPTEYLLLDKLVIQPTDKDKIIANKNNEIANKNKEIANKDNEIANKNKEIVNKDNEIAKLKQQIEDYRTSNSWRAGRALTWLPRKVKGGLRCCREHGVAYTIKYVASKIVPNIAPPRITRTPKVSVIVPVHNVKDYLPQCIDSICAQTLKEIEIVCVDDGSTDGSDSILQAYAARDSRIRVFSQPNLRAGIARNNGLKRAVGDYVIFLDSDDFYEPTLVEDLYCKATQTNADIVICGGTRYDTATGKFNVQRHFLQTRYWYDKTTISRHDVPDTIMTITNPGPTNKLFKRRFLLEQGLSFAPLANSEDFGMVMLAICLAQRIAYVDKILVHYRIGTANSLETKKVSYPTCFIDALERLYDELHERNVYKEVEKSFVTRALSTVAYNIHRLENTAAYNDVVEQFKQSHFARMKLLEHPKNWYTNYKDYESLLACLK